MKVSNPFQAIAKDPIQRIIRVHARSVAKARKSRACDEFVSSAPPCDARQCRIIINALRREIDRLMRGIDRSALCHRPRFADTLKTQPNSNSGGGSSNATDALNALAAAPSSATPRKIASLGPPLAPQTLAGLGDIDPNNSNITARSSGEGLIDLLA